MLFLSLSQEMFLACCEAVWHIPKGSGQVSGMDGASSRCVSGCGERRGDSTERE